MHDNLANKNRFMKANGLETLSQVNLANDGENTLSSPPRIDAVRLINVQLIRSQSELRGNELTAFLVFSRSISVVPWILAR